MRRMRRDEMPINPKWHWILLRWRRILPFREHLLEHVVGAYEICPLVGVETSDGGVERVKALQNLDERLRFNVTDNIHVNSSDAKTTKQNHPNFLAIAARLN